MFSLRRKYKIVVISTLLVLLQSCNKSTRVIIPVAQIPVEHTPIILEKDSITTTSSDIAQQSTLNYSDWLIGKKSLGPLKIGMSMKEVDSILVSMNKQVGLALDFGFGGGSPAYVYSIDTVPILAVVQALNSKKVFAIVVLSDQLKTASGLHPKMKVYQLLEVYPQMEFYLDYMNGWEIASDDTNQWSFIFVTNKSNQIGIYPQQEKPSLAKKTIATNTWILIQ